jgi:serine O-acetyltransferase
MARLPGWKALREGVGWAKRTLARAAEDVRAIEEKDPAARTPFEIVLVYPGLHALWLHRAAHALWEGEMLLGARVLAHANRFITGIEIHPGARIGRRVVIDHGMGIVIGETATVGDGCLLYKGVVLGGTSRERRLRHPQVGSDVVIGSNACVLGAIHVGDKARIGSGSVVVKDVPAESTVVGVPARVVVPRHARFDAALDHANLPDPVADLVRALADQNEKLRERVAALEKRIGLEHEEAPFHVTYEGEELPRADGG